LPVSGVFAAPTVAGAIDEASAAYDQGDYPTVLRLMRPLAEQGNAVAQHTLAVMYFNGLDDRFHETYRLVHDSEKPSAPFPRRREPSERRMRRDYLIPAFAGMTPVDMIRTSEALN
jgi:TPR repeat protein